MKFEHAGKTYFLEFQRRHKAVRTVRNGVTTVAQSKYPYTTAKVLVLEETGKPPVEFAQAEVGCLPSDPYSHEAGRIAALRQLGDSLPKPLRKAMWQAYTARR